MRYYLDTDTISLLQRGDTTVLQNCLAHSPEDILITVITLHEQMDGRFKAIHQAHTPKALSIAYQQFTLTFILLRETPVAAFSESAIQRYEGLLKMKLNVGKNDLRIAAIALEDGATIVTRNRRDFSRVPNLVIEDWSVSL